MRKVRDEVAANKRKKRQSSDNINNNTHTRAHERRKQKKSWSGCRWRSIATTTTTMWMQSFFFAANTKTQQTRQQSNAKDKRNDGIWSVHDKCFEILKIFLFVFFSALRFIGSASFGFAKIARCAKARANRTFRDSFCVLISAYLSSSPQANAQCCVSAAGRWANTIETKLRRKFVLPIFFFFQHFRSYVLLVYSSTTTTTSVWLRFCAALPHRKPAISLASFECHARRRYFSSIGDKKACVTSAFLQRISLHVRNTIEKSGFVATNQQILLNHSRNDIYSPHK